MDQRRGTHGRHTAMRGTPRRRCPLSVVTSARLAVVTGSLLAISTVTCCTTKECEKDCFGRGAKQAWCNGMFCVCDIDFRFPKMKNPPPFISPVDVVRAGDAYSNKPTAIDWIVKK
ncbi:uncharacterized protein LOC142590879 [Dermacentor variabilis]|uniref:uncharacterized protein LOC142590879 n=1 Tax=Dermacentor variabilis TaxID=34621 RepID=UPI003F5C0E26